MAANLRIGSLCSSPLPSNRGCSSYQPGTFHGLFRQEQKGLALRAVSSSERKWHIMWDEEKGNL